MIKLAGLYILGENFKKIYVGYNDRTFCHLLMRSQWKLVMHGTQSPRNVGKRVEVKDMGYEYFRTSATAGGRGCYCCDCNGNSGYKAHNTRVSQTLGQDGQNLTFRHRASSI